MAGCHINSKTKKCVKTNGRNNKTKCLMRRKTKRCVFRKSQKGGADNFDTSLEAVLKAEINERRQQLKEALKYLLDYTEGEISKKRKRETDEEEKPWSKRRKLIGVIEYLHNVFESEKYIDDKFEIEEIIINDIIDLKKLHGKLLDLYLNMNNSNCTEIKNLTYKLNQKLDDFYKKTDIEPRLYL